MTATVTTFSVEETSTQLVARIQRAHLLNETQIHQTSRELLALCLQAAASHRSLIVDFSDVQFISSAMIGKLLELKQSADQQDVTVQFKNLCSEIRQVLKIMRLESAFQLK